MNTQCTPRVLDLDVSKDHMDNQHFYSEDVDISELSEHFLCRRHQNRRDTGGRIPPNESRHVSSHSFYHRSVVRQHHTANMSTLHPLSLSWNPVSLPTQVVVTCGACTCEPSVHQLTWLSCHKGDREGHGQHSYSCEGHTGVWSDYILFCRI